MVSRSGGAEGEDTEPPPKFATFTKGAGVAARLQLQQQQQNNKQLLQEQKESLPQQQQPPLQPHQQVWRVCSPLGSCVRIPVCSH